MRTFQHCFVFYRLGNDDQWIGRDRSWYDFIENVEEIRSKTNTGIFKSEYYSECVFLGVEAFWVFSRNSQLIKTLSWLLLLNLIDKNSSLGSVLHKDNLFRELLILFIFVGSKKNIYFPRHPFTFCGPQI